MTVPTTDAPPPLTVPWGREGSLTLAWPGGWPAPLVFEPDLSGAIADYPAALTRALDEPIGGPPLAELVRPGASVAVVVDDPSRWTPVREALPVVLDRLRALGVHREAITISVGVGRHRAVDADGLRRRVGDAVFDTHACYSPPLDDASQYVDLGTTPEGVPVRVFRPVAEADLRVLVGSVLPHLQAGFGGGSKLIFPGCSHRATLGALHRQGLGGHADAARLLGGDVASNPMRQAIRHAAALLRGPSVSVSHVLGAPGQVFRVAAGDVERVQGVLSDEARRRFEAGPAEPADLVVAGNFPWPGDPLMSFKALINHRSAGRPGGVLAGLFWTEPGEIDRSMPLGALRAIAASGAAGGWLIRRGLKAADRVLAALRHPARFMLRWARELVADRTVLVYSPPLHARIGPRLGPVRVFAELEPLWDAAERSLGGPPRSVRAFPHGGLTYVPYRVL
jgi:hypothetical protein